MSVTTNTSTPHVDEKSGRSFLQESAPSSRPPRVAVVYLLWSQEPYHWLDDALRGMVNQSYPKDSWEIVMIYNSFRHGENSAIDYIRQRFSDFSEKLPRYTILDQPKNWGFAGGNNIGMRYAMEHGFDYVFLHNGDAFMGERCIEEIVQTMEADKTIGTAQSLILLHPESELINSAGNSLHYLGFGFCDQYRISKKSFQPPEKNDIGYASGAAVMMRCDLLKKYGVWDEEYFLYHEDTDYSLKLRLFGYRVVLVPASEFFHKYAFSRSIQKYYWMERNRYALILLFYKFSTILLLLPMFMVLELGLSSFSLLRGWHRERVKAYWYWLQPKHWKLWLSKRKKFQQNRTISDRELLRFTVDEIQFQESAVENPLLRWIGNPLMRIYGRLARALIRW